MKRYAVVGSATKIYLLHRRALMGWRRVLGRGGLRSAGRAKGRMADLARVRWQAPSPLPCAQG